MAINNPPDWLQNAGATHTAAMMRSALSGLFSPALAPSSLVAAGGVNWQVGNAYQVTAQASPNMSILVRSGICYVPGSESGTQGLYCVQNDADFTIAIASNGSGNPRIDSIFVKVQDSVYSGVVDAASLVVVQGTPAGSPSPPAAPNNAIRLANIAVANGAATITNANITDVRPYLQMAAGAGVNVQVFTSSGTWTKPSGVQSMEVIVVAGGGGSGGVATTVAAQAAAAGGGGGGGHSIRYLTFAEVLALGATVAVTVGTGGAGGAAGANNGSAGNNSSFGTSTVTATGGGGGTGMAATASFNYATGGLGGVGTTAAGTFINGSGSDGCHATVITALISAFGNGGASLLGGATIPAGLVNGTTGKNYGGGGAGPASNASVAQKAGGNGGPGIVIVISYL